MRPGQWVKTLRVGRARTFAEAEHSWHVATEAQPINRSRWAAVDAAHALVHVSKMPNLGRKHPLKCLRKITGRRNHPSGISRLAYAAVVMALGHALPSRRPRVVYDAIRLAARTVADLRTLLEKAASYAYALAHRCVAPEDRDRAPHAGAFGLRDAGEERAHHDLFESDSEARCGQH